jgi:single-stranded DNA-specific DHH superfamily exonuclease
VARRKEAVRALVAVCEEKGQGTRYDKYFIEEFVKKIKTTEDIESLIERLREATDFITEIEDAINLNSTKNEQQKVQAKKDEELKKQEDQKKGDWTPDELSKLAKAIVKYPGAIPNRWKVITEFIGTEKTQK